jgi:hypothetical protein
MEDAVDGLGRPHLWLVVEFKVTDMAEREPASLIECEPRNRYQQVGWCTEFQAPKGDVQKYPITLWSITLVHAHDKRRQTRFFSLDRLSFVRRGAVYRAT